MPNSPIISCEVIDINPLTVSLTGDNTVLIRHHSTAKVTMYAEAQGGASIDSDTCLIKCDGKTVFGTEGTFENVSTNTFVCSAADSESRGGRFVQTSPMVDYIKLTCHAAESKPDANGDVILVCSGDYFNDSFGVQSNFIEVSYRYRERGGTWNGYIPMTVTMSNNSYTAYANLSGLDYKKSYDFEFMAADRMMAVNASSLNVVSKPVFHWGKNDVVFEAPVSFNEGVNSFTVNGNLYLSNNCFLAYSNEELLIYAPSIYLAIGGKSVPLPEFGTWTPSLTWSGVYESRSGWYSKSGNVVTLGFHIKMTCDYGGTNENITIYGLPYYPAKAAASGGMCSGAYVGAGFNFQCFVAETDGSITTRVQACNNTAAGNLSTSASGCKYPSNAVLTLSGTITYMIE